MESLVPSLPNLKRITTCRVESLVLLLALACLLIARVLPAQPLKMLSMSMQMTTDSVHATLGEEAQSHHDCFDGALRCMNMMGGLCPLAQVNCVPAFATHWVVPQTHSPVLSVDVAGSSLWPNVPKQPPRL